MPTLTQDHLAKVICSRLCHDLISPLGAIQNGLEFIFSSQDQADPEIINLVQANTETALQRLMAFRAACGLGGESLLNTPEKIDTLLTAFLKAHQIHFEWVNVSRRTLPENFVWPLWGRFMVLSGILMTESLPRGGRLTLTMSADSHDNFNVQFKAEGTVYPLKPQILAYIKGVGTIESLNPISVLGYLASQYAQELELRFKNYELVDQTWVLSLVKQHASELNTNMLF